MRDLVKYRHVPLAVWGFQRGAPPFGRRRHALPLRLALVPRQPQFDEPLHELFEREAHGGGRLGKQAGGGHAGQGVDFEQHRVLLVFQDKIGAAVAGNAQSPVGRQGHVLDALGQFGGNGRRADFLGPARGVFAGVVKDLAGGGLDQNRRQGFWRLFVSLQRAQHAAGILPSSARG